MRTVSGRDGADVATAALGVASCGAVVFTGDDRSKAEVVHAKFLGAYGLAASQVPLLHVAPVKAWYTQWGIESFEET